MLCLRCSRGLSAFSKLPITSTSRTAQRLTTSSTRTFSSFTTPRPTLSSSFRPSLSNSATTAPSTAQEAAILPFKISTHPAMESMQVRCAPRNTFSPSHFVRKRRHGFLTRLKSRTGRMILKRRRAKKRSTLSH